MVLMKAISLLASPVSLKVMLPVTPSIWTPLSASRIAVVSVELAVSMALKMCIRDSLISAKDYIILQLTGRAVGDMTACSTAGAMDMASGTWDSRILSAAGIDLSLLPELYYPHQAVGTMSKKGAEATGFDAGIKVYAGVGLSIIHIS